MPVFAWERWLHAWIARVSRPVRPGLHGLNVALADEGIILGALPIILWLTSWEVGLTIGVSLLVTSTKVEDHLKGLVRRGRPRDPTEWGFPSGDCALVSVWAPLLLGWWAVVPIVLVAWARVAQDAHWPLDTVGGVGVGLWLVSPLLLRGMIQ